MRPLPRAMSNRRRSAFRRIEELEQRLAPAILVGISNATIAEGDSGSAVMNFTVTRSGDLGPQVSVGYSTADGTAHAGTDYTAATGTVTVPAGASSATIAVPVTGNLLLQPNRSFSVQLTGVGDVSTPVSFGNTSSFSTGAGPLSVAVRDLNGDGKPDLVSANYNGGGVSVFMNTTSPGATTPTFGLRVDFPTGTGAYSVAAGDLNGDGKPDLAVANAGAGTVSVLLNTTSPGSTTASFATKKDLTTGSRPYSVAVGDLNGDGKPDLAVANSASNSVSVLLNGTTPGSTTASFATKQDISTGGRPWSVAVSDLNGDGKPDLAVASFNSDSVSVLLNATATGLTTVSFPTRQDITTASLPNSVAVGDLNGDGKPDLAVASLGTNSVSVLLNATMPGSTTASFSTKQDFAVATSPRSVALGDLNGDGRLDLAVASSNSSANGLSVLTNATAPGSAAASFATRSNFLPVGTTFRSVAVGDLNGDGKPDLAAVGNGLSSITTLLNATTTGTSTVSLAPRQDFGTGSLPYSVAVGDLNGDGKPDVAVANFNSGTVSVLMNTTAPGTTTPSFASKVDIGTGPNPIAVAVGDLNGDGKPDLAVANYGSSTVSVLLNTTTPGSTLATFIPKQDFGTGTGLRFVALGDFNGDGKPDLTVANAQSNTVSILANATGPGSTIASFATKQDFFTGSLPWAEAVGDLNGDGKPDLAVANYRSGIVSVLLNTTSTGSTPFTFAAKKDLTAGTAPFSVALGDFNGDGKPDLAVANDYSPSSLSVLLNTTPTGGPAASFSTRQTFGTSLFPSAVAVGDVNGDGKPDLASASYYAPGSVALLLNATSPGSATANFATHQDFGTGSKSLAVALADFNGDGRPDVLVANRNVSSVSVLLNAQSATITGGTATGTILDDDSPVTIAPVAGDNQSAATGATFPIPLAVEIRNANGHLVQGVSVTFAAPTTGPSGTFPGAQSVATVTTDVSGRATAPAFTANATAGNYVVTAQAAGLATIVGFHLTNRSPAPTDPTDGDPATNAVAEGAASGTAVGLTASSSNTGGPAPTYSLTDSAGGRFTIDAITGVVTVADGSLLNYEMVTSHTITVQASDGSGGTSTSSFTIAVTNVNPTVPSDADAADNAVAEGAAVGTAVGVTTSSSDPNGPAVIYSLIDGAGGRFQIDPATGVVTVLDSSLEAPESGSSYQITVQASDGHGGASTQHFTITVNRAPVAVDDAYSTDEDTPLSIAAPGVLANDIDLDSPTLTSVLVTGPGHGTLSLNPDGSFTYTPIANYNGTDSFTYRAGDGSATSAPAAVTITVNAVNDAPVAVNDNYPATEDTPLTVTAPGVLANDSDVDGDTMTAVLVSGPASGILSLNPNGSYTYTPAPNFNGFASFTYRASDGVLTSELATVTILVAGVNDPPMALNDSYSTDEDTPLSVGAPGVLGNDSDVDGGPLTAVLGSSPSNGTLTFNSNGTFLYTPAANFNGTDSFTYRAFDGQLQSIFAATVTITVNAVNDPPAAVNDAYSTNEDTALTIAAPGVLANDTDTESGTLTAVLASGPANGTLSLNSNGSFTFTPAANFNGTDSFSYRASDGAATSTLATVTITVIPVNDAPAAANDSYSTNEDTPLSIGAPGVLANDLDPDGSLLAAILVSGPANGTLSLNSNGSFTYTPGANFNGSDTFTYGASDGNATSAPAIVTITVIPDNDRPVVHDDLLPDVLTDEDTAKIIQPVPLLANDTDSDGDLLVIDSVSLLSDLGATVRLLSDRTISYDPTTSQILQSLKAGETAVDRFEYRASDGSLVSSGTARVTLTVAGVNDAPTATPGTRTTEEDTALTGTVSGNDIDADALTYSVADSPVHGTLVLNAGGAYTYTPAADFHGTDSFTFRANDGNATSSPAAVTITVNADEDPPASTNDSYTMSEDTTLSIAAPGVLTNDLDADGDSVTAVLVSGPSSGSLTLNPDGSFTYTPAANFNGSDGFSYRAFDGVAQGNIASVAITIQAVNDAPVASSSTLDTTEDTPATGSVSASDVDQDVLSYSVVSTTAHGVLVLDPSGTYTYTPASDFRGADSFTFKANDGAADSNVATVSITVDAVNDAPVVTLPAFAPRVGYYDMVAGQGVPAQAAPIVAAGGVPIPVFNLSAAELAGLDVLLVQNPSTVEFGSEYLAHLADIDSAVFGGLTLVLHDRFVDDAESILPDGGGFTVVADFSDDQNIDVLAPASLVTSGPGGQVDNATLDGGTKSNHGYAASSSLPGTARRLLSTSDPSHVVAFSYGFGGGSVVYSTIPLDFYLAGGGPLGVSSNFRNIYGPNVVAYATALSRAQPATAEDMPLTVHGISVADPDVDDAAEGVLDVTVTVDHGTVTLADVAGLVNVNGDGTGAVTLRGRLAEINEALEGLVYAPAANFNGLATLTVSVNDRGNTGSGGPKSDFASTRIIIRPVNDAPTAASQSVETDEDTPMPITLTGADIDGDRLDFVVVDGPAHGTLSGTGASLVYTPAANYDGPDRFTFRSTDGVLSSGLATVTITVNSTNDAPVASDDAYSTSEDHGLTIAPAAGVLANDSDTDGDPLTVALVAGPAHGTLALAADGSFTYTPDANYSGPDGFTYDISDGAGGTATAHVALTVVAVADDPALVVSSPGGSEDTPFSVVVTPSLTDMDGSEVLLDVRVRGVPLGASFNRGTLVGSFDGLNVWSIAADQLDGLTMTVPDGPASFVLTVTAFSREASNLGTAEHSEPLAIEVTNVDPTAMLSTNSGITYGTAATATLGSALDPSSTDTTEGFHYAFSIDVDCTAQATYANSDTNSSTSFGVLDAGTHTVYARIIDKNDGFTEYTMTLVINKADAVVKVNGYHGTYDAALHGATGNVVGVPGDLGAAGSSLDLGLSFRNAPGGTAYWTFTGGTNYLNENGSVDIIIDKANATIGVTPYSVFYDGLAHTAAGTAVGVAGESLSGLSLSGTTHTIVGDYPADPWTFTDVTGNYNNASGTVHDRITLAIGSAYILNPSASGAVTASGKASVDLAGGLFVSSGSSSAIVASGNARINVGGTVQVVGGISKSGNASVTKTGAPAATGDPLAGLSPPALAGTNYGAVSVAGNTTKTLDPGLYTSIQASGNAKLILNPGTYLILGGGFVISGNASVSGSGVTIFNAGSRYDGTTDSGNFGGITLSGNGNFDLSPPTSGDYQGILIYQSRANTRALSISGNATADLDGTIYAANATLSMSGNGHLHDALVVNSLNISGNVALSQVAAGGDVASDAGSIANSLLAGDLAVYVSTTDGGFSPEMLARIQDAILSIDQLLVPYNVTISAVNDPALATVVIDIGMASASGTAVEGVLGSFDPGSYPATITILQGWNWYAGSDPTGIEGGQYDFQTTVTHELGHALGLGHSESAVSPMNGVLMTGTVHRQMTVADLNIASAPEGVEPQTAAGFAGDRQSPARTGSAGATVGQAGFPGASAPLFAVPATSAGVPSNGMMSSPISVGLPTASGTVTSTVGGGLGQALGTATAPASTLRLIAHDERNSNNRRALTDTIAGIHRRSGGGTSPGEVTTGRLGLSAIAIDAALAELDSLPIDLFERPAGTPSPEAEPIVPQILDDPGTWEEQGDSDSNVQSADAVIAAAAAFFMAERTVRRSRNGKDRTQPRRLLPLPRRNEN